jgi:hypothetical protein
MIKSSIRPLREIHDVGDTGRLVLYEAQELLTLADYRKAVTTLRGQVAVGIQWVVVCSTMAPMNESRFLTEIGWKSGRTWIREETRNRGASYQLVDLRKARNNQVTAVEILLQGLTMEVFGTSGGRAVLWVRSMEAAEQLGRRVGGLVIHEGMTPIQQEEALSAWGSGTQWCVVATLAVHWGERLAGADAIIFVGEPEGMLSLATGCRVGAKDQRSCYVFVLRCGELGDGKLEGYMGMEALTEWLNAQGECLRRGIEGWTEGVSERCMEIENAERCGICDRKSVVAQLGVRCRDEMQVEWGSEDEG